MCIGVVLCIILSFVVGLCSLVDEIIAFSHNIGEWLFGALQDLPAALGIRKMQSKSIDIICICNCMC
jgi:hypothetical protein